MAELNTIWNEQQFNDALVGLAHFAAQDESEIYALELAIKTLQGRLTNLKAYPKTRRDEITDEAQRWVAAGNEGHPHDLVEIRRTVTVDYDDEDMLAMCEHFAPEFIKRSLKKGPLRKAILAGNGPNDNYGTVVGEQVVVAIKAHSHLAINITT